MKLHAVWHELAVEEFLSAIKWYEGQRRGLGTEFEFACRAAIALIEQHSSSFPFVHGEIRRVVLRRFPYSLHDSIGFGRAELGHGRGTYSTARGRVAKGMG